MLKPPEPEPKPDRPIGDIVGQLVDDGKAYASAEIGLVQAVAVAKARLLAWPAGLFLAALIVLQSAVTILAVGIFMALLNPIGPILAAIVASLIFSAIAGLLGWIGYNKLKEIL